MSKKITTAKRSHQFSLFILISLVALVVLVLSISLFKRSSDNRSQAAYQQVICNSSFGSNVLVSADGKNFDKTISINNTVTRYYLKVGAGCTTTLDVQFNGRVIEKWGTNPWGVYTTNQEGVARIDFNKPLPEGRYTAQVKPHGANVAWSNEFTVIVESNASKGNSSQVINLSEYWPSQPGYSYIFDSYNSFTKSKTQSRIILEELTDWCGYSVVPWQFLKDHPNAYWGQTIPGMGGEGKSVIRWMMSNPNTTTPGVGAEYNSWISYVGHKLYPMTDLKEIKAGDQVGVPRQYQTFNPSLPAYGIGKKVLTVPSKEFIDGVDYAIIANSSLCPKVHVPGAVAPDSFDGWSLRYEFEDITIPAGSPGEYTYSGPALRIDFYEYYTTNANNHNFADVNTTKFFRETWYLVKGVGPVKVIGATYNGYGNLPICTDEYVISNGKGCSKDCSKDADCLADTITKPTYYMHLKKYFKNPQLSVNVATNPNTAGVNSITIKQGEPYYLNMSVVTDADNPVAYPYTGYLEAKLSNGNPTKWLWAENGVVYVAPAVTKSIPAGVYNATFRVWVPDTKYPFETKVSDTNIPWSNQISVTVQSAN